MTAIYFGPIDAGNIMYTDMLYSTSNACSLCAFRIVTKTFHKKCLNTPLFIRVI